MWCEACLGRDAQEASALRHALRTGGIWLSRRGDGVTSRTYKGKRVGSACVGWEGAQQEAPPEMVPNLGTVLWVRFHP